MLFRFIEYYGLCKLINIPGILHSGFFEYLKYVSAMHVTSLLPSFTASGLEHSTSTTVPGFTGNCVVVSIVLFHSVFSPVQSGAVEVFVLSK